VTFSKIAYLGRSSPSKRAQSAHNPLRSASIPPCSPATDKSWHGNPPVMMSGLIPSRRSRSAVIVRTSSYIGTSGQFFFNTFCAYGSISQKATVSNPARSKPSVNPPMPANKSKTFIPFDHIACGIHIVPNRLCPTNTIICTKVLHHAHQPCLYSVVGQRCPSTKRKTNNGIYRSS